MSRLRFDVPLYVYALLVLAGVIYAIWLFNNYHSPPLSCYLTGCHFTLLGWQQ